MRLDYMEKNQDVIKERVDYVQKQTEEMVKIALILDQQTQQNKEQNETMKKINDNLTILNNTTNRLGERVTDLETEVKEQTQRGTIVISEALRKYGGGGLLIAIGVIVTWVLAQFGIVG